ncbi:MAG: N-acetyltransferase [Rhodospirillaceae bacterium]|nr:N-acetyltransferase [Rhodospirillaceae bacterium]MDD9913792.1 N-acetyltransferase [Rhodospirillaceae bacterium]MDD9925257.1 N-acetyltransferase [Rhodospirillaceae bacterium]
MIGISESQPDDLASIERIYPAAFPDEDLLPLVRALLTQRSTVLSLVARAENAVVGHILFTPCTLIGQSARIALLGPLAVALGHQHQGIGGALVREGFTQLEESGVSGVCVLGDPQYYRRFGFAPTETIAPPYPLPPEWKEAWQALAFSNNALPLSGTLSVPTPWQEPALWGP